MLPIITGLAKFKYLSNAYRGFFAALVVSFLNQNLSLLTNEPVALNLINYTYIILWSTCMLYALLHWLELKRIRQTLLIYLAIVVALMLVEAMWLGMSVFRSSVLKSIVYGLILLLTLRVLVLSLGERTNYTARLSKILIVAPTMVFTIYYISLNILMYFLFSYNTMKLFQSLFGVINTINTLYYLSFTLAFLWAPKKEQFL